MKSLSDGVCAICSGLLKRDGNVLGHRQDPDDDGDGLLGDSVSPTKTPTPESIQNEPVHTLGCHHSFHSSCIRGWCVIGKRDICPYWYVSLSYI